LLRSRQASINVAFSQQPGNVSFHQRTLDGRVFAIVPWRLVEYWNMTPDFDPAEQVH